MDKIINNLRTIILYTIVFYTTPFFAQVGIGTIDIDNSAQLELKSSNRGFLLPRLTANERESINNPSEGLMVFCTNCCENGSVNFYNDSYWYNTSACPDIDFDNDGVPNDLDFDDDNDGIYDIDEGDDTPTYSTVTTLTKQTGTGSSSNVDVGDIYLYNDVLTSADGTTYDLTVKVLALKLDGNAKVGIGISGNKPKINYANFKAVNKNYANIRCQYITNGTSTPSNPEGTGVDVAFTSVSIGDIESTTPSSDNASEIGGVGPARKTNNDIVPIDRTFKNAGSNSWIKFNQGFTGGTPAAISGSNYNLMTVDKAYASPNNSWKGEGKIGSNDNIGTGTFYYNEFSSVEVIFGYTGTTTDKQARAAVIDIGTTADVNTVTTSSSDHVNYDSDNDGCFDALEASGSSINTSLIDNIGRIKGLVNVDGIPLTISVSQGIGDSKNSGVSTACP